MSAVLDLADLATEQWGLVTTAQARSLDVSPQAVARLANQGALERMMHGVYRVTGAPPSPLDDLRAAWLALDPARRARERLRDEAPTVVSHRSAAAIHELGDLEADEYEFTSGERKQTRRTDIRIHRGKVGAEEWTVVDGLPVTSVVRTVADLAAAHVDGGHLAGVVRDALTRQQVHDRQLIDVLRHHSHHYNARMGDGEALLSRLLQESGISESIERAVKLAGAQAPGNAGDRVHRDSDHQPQFQQLREQLASIERAITSVARLSEQITNSPAMKATADADATMAELARLLRSPAMQRLAEQAPEMAEVSRLARRVSEAVRVPEIAIPESDLLEIEEDGE
jgi:predicted transcriptional regulator of viral defense system